MLTKIATILSVLGAILNANKQISGFYLWTISNILWIIYGYRSKQKYLTITFITYLIITLYGIWNWTHF